MIQVNLLPWRQRRLRRQLYIWYRHVVIALILCSLLLSTTHIAMQRLNKQQQRRWQAAQLLHAQEAKQPLSHGGEWRQQLQQRYQQPVQLLTLLPRLITQGIYLQHLQWQPPQLTIRGAALSYQLLANLVDELQKREIDQCSQHPQPQCPLKIVQAVTDSSQIATVQFTLQCNCCWIQAPNDTVNP